MQKPHSVACVLLLLMILAPCSVRHAHADRHDQKSTPEGRRSPKIKFVHVIGERHSGTNFMYRFLQQNLPAEHYQVDNHFVDHKHAVQWPKRGKDAKNRYAQHLVIVMFRNPYDWALAMGKECWCNYTEEDESGYRKAVHSELNDLPFHQFLSAPFQAHDHFVGELWRGLSPGPTVMDLRAGKVAAYLNMSRWAENVEYVRLEDVMGDDESLDWLNQLMQKYHLFNLTGELQPMKTYKDSEQKSFRKTAAMRKSVWFNRALIDARPDLRQAMIEINKHMDVVTERILGYDIITV